MQPGAKHAVGPCQKQTELALNAINRPRPYRPLKVVPHDPMRNPRLVTAIKGWITTEIFLVNRTPEEMERLLGFDGRPGREYLAEVHEHLVIERTSRRLTKSLHLLLADDQHARFPPSAPFRGSDRSWSRKPLSSGNTSAIDRRAEVLRKATRFIIPEWR